MQKINRSSIILCLFCLALQSKAQPYFQATAVIAGNSIVVKVMPKQGNITCGWIDIEFFFRNSSGLPNADGFFANSVVVVNATDFPDVSIDYNEPMGMNNQGTETGYNNYWFGGPFLPTPQITYLQNQEYVLCTINLPSSPAPYDLELCHNDGSSPHYITMTDQSSLERCNTTGTNKFYGPGAVICSPTNCPASTPGANHILPLDGSLPVELMSFQAYPEGKNTARLEWQTATEVNFQEFEIERLQQGAWQTIGRVPAKGRDGAGAAYTYYDDRAPAPVAYYRLRMVDYDASFAYSPVRSVMFDLDDALQVFPNPVAETLFLRFGSEWAEGDLRVEILDGVGRVIFQRVVAVAPNETLPLPLSPALPADGLYLFRASAAGGFVYSRPLIVLAGSR